MECIFSASAFVYELVNYMRISPQSYALFSTLMLILFPTRLLGVISVSCNPKTSFIYWFSEFNFSRRMSRVIRSWVSFQTWFLSIGGHYLQCVFLPISNGYLPLAAFKRSIQSAVLCLSLFIIEVCERLFDKVFCKILNPDCKWATRMDNKEVSETESGWRSIKWTNLLKGLHGVVRWNGLF